MYRAIPTSNKTLQAKWQDKDMRLHHENLRKIKGTVDMKEPQQFKHLKKKMKKTQMMEERYTEIERENRILLEKMTNILQKQRGTLFSANSAGAVGSGGFSQPPGQRSQLNMGSNDMTHLTLQPAITVAQRKSLNREARKRELVKITKENQMILKRLQEKKPNYNIATWQKEEDSRKKILQNICEYPLIDSQEGPDFIIRKKKGSATTGAFYKKVKGYSGANKQMQNQQFVNKIIKKQSLYSGEHDLGNGVYMVEMLISQTDDLVISAQHVELPDSFIIEIEAPKVSKLIQEFNNDFNFMANYLKIMNKRMVLLNPKFMNKQQEQEGGGEDGQEGANNEELDNSQVQAEMNEEAKIAEGEEQQPGDVIEDEQNPIDAEYQQQQLMHESAPPDMVEEEGGVAAEMEHEEMDQTSQEALQQADPKHTLIADADQEVMQQKMTEVEETPEVNRGKPEEILQEQNVMVKSIDTFEGQGSRLSQTQKAQDYAIVAENGEQSVVYADNQQTQDANALQNINQETESKVVE